MSQPALQSVWRLDSDGRWVVLSETVDERFAALAEMVSTMVSSELGERAELQARFPDVTLEARRTQGVVTALLRKNDVHPLLIKTALQRVELASQRGASGDATSGLHSSRAPIRSFRLDEEAPTASFRPATGSAQLMTAQKAGAHIGTSQELDSFEIDFLTEPQAPTHTNAACTWQQAMAWIEESIVWSARYVGRSVSCNYWRELLTSELSFAATPKVGFSGTVSMPSGATEYMTSGEVAALSALHAEWLKRCSRVIPNAETEVAETLPAPPWTPGNADINRSLV